jgi:hypothetical protein
MKKLLHYFSPLLVFALIPFASNAQLHLEYAQGIDNPTSNSQKYLEVDDDENKYSVFLAWSDYTIAGMTGTHKFLVTCLAVITQSL